MTLQLPRKILVKHEGKWVAWDTDTGEFLGAAKTYDELSEMVEPANRGRVIGYERVIPRDAVIVSGFEL